MQKSRRWRDDQAWLLMAGFGSIICCIFNVKPELQHLSETSFCIMSPFVVPKPWSAVPSWISSPLRRLSLRVVSQCLPSSDRMRMCTLCGNDHPVLSSLTPVTRFKCRLKIKPLLRQADRRPSCPPRDSPPDYNSAGRLPPLPIQYIIYFNLWSIVLLCRKPASLFESIKHRKLWKPWDARGNITQKHKHNVA